MKLTILLLTTVILQLSANSFAQKITLSEKKASLTTVFEKIRAQTGYDFLVTENMLKNAKPVTIQARNEEVLDVLNKVFENQNLTFIIKSNSIIVKERESHLWYRPFTYQIPADISGRIVDENGKGIPGATIKIKGADQGGISDTNGKFLMKNIKSDAVLVVSYIGYITQEIKVVPGTEMNIIMVATSSGLEEIVVVGYGTQKKSDLTGAVSQISMDKVLGDRPITTVASALQGAVPGLTITPSAVPGQAAAFNIRGTTSINGGGPLVLIDNAPGDINMLNPQDVESVSVLKDAASTAIYGARAAFGVILVTTKRARKNSKTTFNYNDNFAFTRPVNQVQQASVADILQTYANWSSTASTAGPEGQDYNKWVKYARDFEANPGNYPADGRYLANDGKLYFLKDNDPQNAIFANYGFQNTHNFSASGGSDKITYRMSLGTVFNNGPLITNKDEYKRYNIGTYVNADLTKWLTSSIDIKYNTSDKSLVDYGNIYTPVQRYYPVGTMQSKIAGDSKLYPTRTPENFLLYGEPGKNIRKETRIFSRTVLTPFKGFEGVVEYTLDDYARDDKSFTRSTNMVEINRNMSPTVATPLYTNNKGNNHITNLNAYASYSYRTPDKNHDFKVLAGFSQDRSYSEDLNVNRKEIISDELPSISGAVGEILADDSFVDFTSRSGFYRINYGFQDKYLLEVNGRYDGSSKFPSASRFGFFPSASAGWQVAKENFMGFSKSWLNEFKLRASWGKIGNQAIAPYGYSPKMDPTRAPWIVGTTQPATIGLPPLVRQDYTWEVVETADLGADFSFLNSRLQASGDIYIRKTKGMLAPGMEFPAVVGAAAPLQNTADLENRGWEAAISWRDQIGKVGYNFGFNVYYSLTKITKYNNASRLLDSYYVGQQLGEIWGYRNDGFYTVDDFKDQTTWVLKDGVTSIKGTSVRPGDVKYKNLSDKGASVANQIDPGANTVDDPGDREIIGNSTPRYAFGMTGGVSYAGFNLSFVLNGVGKRDVWVSDELSFPMANNTSTVYAHQLDYWQPIDAASGNWNPINANAKYPRIYNDNNNRASNIRIQDRYLLKAAYLRLKNVSLAYALPSQLVKKAGLNAVKIFTSIENPLTWSDLEKGRDPESLSWGYPFYSTASFGLNVTF